jgi:hypothetical protein
VNAIVQSNITFHVARGHDDSWMAAAIRAGEIEDAGRLETGDVYVVIETGYNPMKRANMHSVVVFNGTGGAVIGRKSVTSLSYAHNAAVQVIFDYTMRMEA